MNARPTQLLQILCIVRSAGSLLEPTWDPHERLGVVYRGTGSPLDDRGLALELEKLADSGYLERVFVERISLCPMCDNHAINVHEACLTCASSNLTESKALFHFRCGFVGPTDAFKEELQGRRCPKCAKILADVGTDFDSPGSFFTCRACAAMFQTPEIGARCLACGARFTGVDLQTIHQHDIFAYRLSALGISAIDEHRLLTVRDD